MLSWKVRIERARKRGKFTAFERDRASNNWRTCAIGEKLHLNTDILPETHDAIYWTRHDLGYEFAEAVLWDNFGKALKLWEKIMRLE